MNRRFMIGVVALVAAAILVVFLVMRPSSVPPVPGTNVVVHDSFAPANDAPLPDRAEHPTEQVVAPQEAADGDGQAEAEVWILRARFRFVDPPGLPGLAAMARVYYAEALPVEARESGASIEEIELADENDTGVFQAELSKDLDDEAYFGRYARSREIQLAAGFALGKSEVGGTATQVAIPRVSGTIIDLGVVELSVQGEFRHLDDHDSWALMGQLVDQRGEPVHSLGGGSGRLPYGGHVEIGLGADDDYWLGGVFTDLQGRFVDEYSVPEHYYGGLDSKTGATRAMFDPREHDWVLNQSGGDYSSGFHPTRLTIRHVDYELGIIDFGTIALAGPVLEIVVDAPETLRWGYPVLSVVSGCVNLTLRTVPLREKVRVVVQAGCYTVSAAFGYDRVQNDRLIVSGYPETEERAFIPSNYLREEVVVEEESVQSVRFEWAPPRDVAVTVEAPDSELPGKISVSYEYHWMTQNRELDGEPWIVRVYPGEPAVVRAAVPGFKPVEAPIPPGVTELMLRVETPSDEGEDSHGFLEIELPDKLRFRAFFVLEGLERWTFQRDVSDGSTEPLRAPPGKYLLHIFGTPTESVPDGKLAKPLEVEIERARVTRIQLSELSYTSSRWTLGIHCGSTSLRGTFPAESVLAPGTIRMLEGRGELLAIRGPSERHEWNPAQAGLSLPPRIELQLSPEFLKLWSGPRPPRTVTEVRFATPYGRASITARTDGGKVSLWAWPGEAEVALHIEQPPTFTWRGTVTVRDGTVSVVRFGAEHAVVSFGPWQAVGLNRTADGLRPVWEIYDSSGTFVGGVDVASKVLPTGSYIAKASFARGEFGEVRFDVITGRENHVELPLLEAVPHSGRVRVPHPPGFSRDMELTVAHESPVWPAYMRDDEHMPRLCFTRHVPEGIIVEGLLIGAPVTVKLVVGRDGEEVAVCEFTVTLHSSELQRVAAAWRAPER